MEEAPPIGRDLLFNDAQIRYCLAQSIRIDAARSQIDRAQHEQVDYFNEMVADFNGRCSRYRHEIGALDAAKRDVEARRPLIAQEARTAFVRHFANAATASAAEGAGAGERRESGERAPPSPVESAAPGTRTPEAAVGRPRPVQPGPDVSAGAAPHADDRSHAGQLPSGPGGAPARPGAEAGRASVPAAPAAQEQRSPPQTPLQSSTLAAPAKPARSETTADSKAQASDASVPAGAASTRPPKSGPGLRVPPDSTPPPSTAASAAERRTESQGAASPPARSDAVQPWPTAPSQSQTPSAPQSEASKQAVNQGLPGAAPVVAAPSPHEKSAASAKRVDSAASPPTAAQPGKASRPQQTAAVVPETAHRNAPTTALAAPPALPPGASSAHVEPAPSQTPAAGAASPSKEAPLERFSREIQAAGSRVIAERDYPPQARGKGWEGIVQIEVRFAAGGFIRSIVVGESSGHAPLDQFAMDVAREAEFPPVPQALQSRDFSVRFPIVFRRS